MDNSVEWEFPCDFTVGKLHVDDEGARGKESERAAPTIQGCFQTRSRTRNRWEITFCWKLKSWEALGFSEWD